MEGFQPPHTLSPSAALLNPKCRFLVPPSLSYLSLYSTLLPRLSPAELRENTKDCGVQVNARVDKCVQCSLGTKTLFCPVRPTSDPDRTRSPSRGGPAHVSPSTLPGGKGAEKKPGEDQESGSESTSLKSVNESYLQDQEKDEQKLQEDTDGSKQQDKGLFYHEGNEKVKRSNVQVKRPIDLFLEQKYGFFHCKKCNIRWESAYVWCIAETSKVYYKQLCRKCRARVNPFRVESIFCQGCLQTACTCEKKQRHIDMKRPHRQDLCCRCKDKKLSCDVSCGFV